MSIDNVNGMNLNEYTIFKSLDGKDGKEDGKIMASIWNEFAPQVGGRKIKNYILETNAVKSIRYYIKRGGEAAVNKICEFLGYNKDTAQQNLTKANQMMNDAANGNVEYTVREYTNEDGTISRVANFTDGTYIFATYDTDGNITSIGVSTNPNENYYGNGRHIDGTEVGFYEDAAYVEAEGYKKTNGKYEYKETQGYGFNEYKALADRIFAKGVTKASASTDSNPIHLNIENSPKITEYINGCNDFLREAANMGEAPTITTGNESDYSWKMATLKDGRSVTVWEYTDGRVNIRISNNTSKYHSHDGSEFDGAEISYTFTKDGGSINVAVNKDKHSDEWDLRDIGITDPNFQNEIMKLVDQIFAKDTTPAAPPAVDANPPSQLEVTTAVNLPRDAECSELMDIVSQHYPQYANKTAKIGDTTYKFNEDGHIFAELDNNGNSIRVIRWDTEGNIGGYFEEEYDANGNQTRSVFREPDGTVYSFDEYTYDENGNQTRHIERDANGNARYIYETEYDANGNETRFIARNGDGSVEYYIVNKKYKYDANGQNIPF